ncbi:hypothetical protein ACFLUV_03745 [Elusimicrobiota bacterium]
MKTRIVLIVVLSLAVIGGTGSAHPPSDFNIDYDFQTKILTVEAVHNVGNADSHYIDDINVYLNGTAIIKQEFKKQFDGNMQKGVYLIIDAAAGNEIKVEADCNHAGGLEKSIILENTVIE